MPLILLIIGVVLIVYNYRAIKREEEHRKEDSSFDISFQSVLQDNKEELNDYKMEIGLLRKDIAESLTELQEEIFFIKKDIHLLKDSNDHLLKDSNDHLLKNDNDINILKNNVEVYDNKEELENNYVEKNHIDISINEPDPALAEDKKEVNEIDDSSFLNPEVSDGIISEINFSAKVDSDKTIRIKNLLSEGLTEEEICHELSVSKGEVLLVKGLFKK